MLEPGTHVVETNLIISHVTFTVYKYWKTKLSSQETFYISYSKQVHEVTLTQVLMNINEWNNISKKKFFFMRKEKRKVQQSAGYFILSQ